MAIGVYVEQFHAVFFPLKPTSLRTRDLSEKDRLELGSWLEDFANPIGGWQCFHTATFRPSAHKPDAYWKKQEGDEPGCPARTEFVAMERYRNFMQEADRRQISWVAAVEPNLDHSRLNKGFHVHAVWADQHHQIHRTTSFKRWANQYGNNKVEAVRDRNHVSLYVAKYCVKQGCQIEFQANGELWHAINGHVRPETQHLVIA